jgi:hypothetical protein
MSWYGLHPKVSKERARQALPPGACKRTVYLARCLPEMSHARQDNVPQTCCFCGVTYVPSEVVARLEKQLETN